MQKEKKEKHFIDQPIYKGGKKAMLDFIKSNLRYPKAALEAQVEGSVHIRYTINHKGEVISASTISGIGYGCDEEAIRVVKLLEFSATKNRKLKIKFNNKISIHFHLPQAAAIETAPDDTQAEEEQKPIAPPPTPTPSFSYTITTSSASKTVPPAVTKKTTKKQGSYTYTINTK